MIEPNRSILRKADMTTGDLASGGLLESAQAEKFIRLLIKESVLMKDAQVKPMRNDKELVEKITFGSRILRAGVEATALPEADRSKPDLSKVELDTKLFKAEVRIPDEVLEDNIEREQLKNTIMELMAERISSDMEEVMVQGDTGSADNFLAQLDGLIVQATTNVFAGGSADLDTDILREVVKLLPSRYHRRRSFYKFYTGVQVREDYAFNLGARATEGGDKHIDTDDALRYRTNPVVALPWMPENLGAGTDESKILYMDPQNVRVGIRRAIKLEEDRLVREGVNVIVASLRFDVKFEEEPAVVKADAIKAL